MDRTWPHAMWWAVALLDLYALYRAVDRSRSPNGTLAWMFAILAFPGVGALAYLWLGNPRLKGLTLRKRKSLRVRRAAVQSVVKFQESGMDDMHLMNLVSKATDLAPTAGNSVTLLAKNENAFDYIHRMVREADRSVWAESYIIRSDESGRRFLEGLVAKAKSGVEVRVLYDAVGSMGLDGKLLEAIRAAGGFVEAFLPINLWRRRWATHLRNHRKIIVVDGRIGLTGSLNVGNEYGGYVKGPVKLFRDTHMALRGPAVRDLALTFSEDWGFATGQMLALPDVTASDGGSYVAMVPSGPYEDVNTHSLVYFTGITSSRERCWITSPYFIPEESILQALVSAAMRGVDVRLLLPFQADIPLVVAAARSYYPSLLRSGVRVFEYRQAILHAKTMVVDGRWGIVGSANVDVRSFRYNFEIGGLVWDPEFASELERVFREDQSGSVEVSWQDVARRGWFHRAEQRVAHLLSPLL